MGLGRQTFKHTAIYSIATVLGRLASFLMLPFYAHIFQAEGYGVIAMIDTSLGLLTILLTGGFQTAILRIYHEQKDGYKNVTIGTGIRLVWGLGILIVIFPLIFSAPLSSFILGDAGYYPLICLALVSFVIDIAGQSASTIQIIRQQSLLFSSISLVRLILGLSLNIWLIVILDMGFIGIFLSSLATAIVSSLVFHIVAFIEHGLGFDRQIAAQLLRFQLPILPGEIIAFIGRQAEAILVRILIGLEGMGILEMAYKFPPLLNLFLTIPFQRAWRTKSIEIADQKDAPCTISAMFTRYLFLMIFLGLLLATTIQSILELMTPPIFWQSAPIAQIEIVTTILAGCTSYLSFGILYRKKTMILSLIKSVLTPAKIFLGFLLISTWGLQGAAYSALLVEIVTLVWIGIKAQALYRIPLEYSKISFMIAGAFIIFHLLNGSNYSDFGPAMYMGKHWFSPLMAFLQATPLGEWKSGKLVLVFQSRQDQLISLVLNTIFSLSFLVLLPLVWRPSFSGRRA
jgi:O-antigen/teichoic acid export membrane protein